jgi:ABC-type transporter Mla subunit MlaD
MSDTTSNLYQELKDALTTFKQFLDSTAATLKPAIATLASIVPQVGDLLTKLITLMGQLKDAINNIDLGAVQGLSQISQFTSNATTLLQTAESLLPAQKSAIDEVLSVANVVTSLPSFSTLKQDILDLLTGIINDLNSLKP